MPAITRRELEELKARLQRDDPDVLDALDEVKTDLPDARTDLSPGARLGSVVSALNAGEVEYVLVGGGAAAAHGAGTDPSAIAIVPQRTQANAERLLGVLKGQGVYIMEPMKRKLRPRVREFLGWGQIKLSTDLGPVNVLCVLHDGRGYKELVDHTVLIEGDLSARVLDLPTLVEVQAGMAHAEDRRIVPALLALLERQVVD